LTVHSISEVSPFGDVTTIEMSPNLEASTGGQIGKDSDEQQRITASLSLGASRKRGAETGRCRSADGAELSSYRQSKRLAKRYREGGAQGLKHGSAGPEYSHLYLEDMMHHT
jgi:hypothetical protein